MRLKSCLVRKASLTRGGTWGRSALWLTLVAVAGCGEPRDAFDASSRQDAATQVDDGGTANLAEPVDAASDPADAGDASSTVDASEPPPPPPPPPCEADTPRVLVLHGGAIGEEHGHTARMTGLLKQHHVEITVAALGDDIEYEIDGAGSYSAIAITDYEAYNDLQADARAKLDDYARRCDVGMFFLYVAANAVVNDGQIEASDSLRLDSARFEADSPVLSLARDGGTLEGALPNRGRFFDVREGEGYEPIAWATNDGEGEGIWALLDRGEHDGIRRVFNGRDFGAHFMTDLVMLDGVAWASSVELSLFRERYIGVDIDDVFMANDNDDPALRTVKIQASDVTALIESQEHISSLIGRDFRYVIGFCHNFYGVQVGDPELYDDVAGDEALAANAAEFYWFDHLKYHAIVGDQTYEVLADMMSDARAWAEETSVLEHIGQYSVTPQHSGISNRYVPLYEAWREVWDIRYSSDTSGAGKGFEYMGVLVMPRQRANIWAAQSTFTDVSEETLTGFALGGIYHGIISRPVSIFMTHQANYARDRIGIYMFEKFFEHATRWTNYELINLSPDQLVEKYFELVPLPDPIEEE